MAKLQPKLEVVRRSVAELHQDPANVRLHPEVNLVAITAALARFGQQKPIVVDGQGVVRAGNGTLAAAGRLGWKEIDVVVTDLVGPEATAYAIADNRTTDLSIFDEEPLLAQLRALEKASIPATDLGFDAKALAALVGTGRGGGHTDPDAVPELVKEPWVKMGDLFQLGEHRVLCGDTTDPQAIARLVGKEVALALLHADPPYGMGKEADGVLNDNLYDDKLDAFQARWWAAWRRVFSERGSAYIWGNAPDLWRWWWKGGLHREHKLMFRNEVVWDKGAIAGMRSAGGHSFPTATERCIFLQRGEQFLGNQNVEDYWDGYEPLRSWLEAERVNAGWTNGDVNKLTKTHMAGHWFTKSQFMPISEIHYDTLRRAAVGRAFVEEYSALFTRLFPEVKEGGNAHRRSLGEHLRSTRTYFDNTHDAMTDVWTFPRVVGEERFGHATHKPVAMVSRAVLSSTQPGDAVGVPFGGTAPEVISCEQLGRRAFIMELNPTFAQVIVERWAAFTGRKWVQVQ